MPNTVSGPFSSIVGGGGNRINPATSAAIVGGQRNTIETQASFSTISGGTGNRIGVNAQDAWIGGGVSNVIGVIGNSAVIGGGEGNEMGYNSTKAVIGGGWNNSTTANSGMAMIPGGRHNTATNLAFAAGNKAKAMHSGAFVWADSQDVDFFSSAVNQFAVRANGGFFLEGNLGVGNRAPSYPLEVQSAQAVARFTTTSNANGAVLSLRNNTASPTYLGAINFEDADGTPGQIGYLANDQMAFRVGGAERMNLQAGGLYVNGVIVHTSDRDAKADFASVDAQEVLEKVAALPLQSWSYTNRPGVKHVGPMAQDFRAAFGLGEDDKHIATVDADGVALAAIQGLNQKVTEELKQKTTEITELTRELAELKSLLGKLSTRGN